MKNRIKALRKKNHLTQSQLADAVRTSQQQIQRIEAGVQAARLDLAVMIAGALGENLEQVFPGTKRPIASLRKSTGEDPAFEDDVLSDKFAEAGIDIDPRIWTFKYLLRNGVAGCYEISGAEKRRLWDAVQSDCSVSSFLIFDTTTQRVAINKKHLIFSHFLFDPPSIIRKPKTGARNLIVYTSCGPAPLEFDVDPDDSKAGEDPEGDDEEANLQNFLFSLEASSEPNDIVDFMDVDGEVAFLRAADIAMLTIPLWAIEPALFQSQLDGLEEEGLEETVQEDLEE